MFVGLHYSLKPMHTSQIVLFIGLLLLRFTKCNLYADELATSGYFCHCSCVHALGSGHGVGMHTISTHSHKSCYEIQKNAYCCLVP